MKSTNDLSDLERYAGKCIAAHRYPNDVHMFNAKKCSACGFVPLELTIEHHSGSKKKNFRGVIFGRCTIQKHSAYIQFYRRSSHTRT